VTPEGFRRMSLSVPDVVEHGHMGHPDWPHGA